MLLTITTTHRPATDLGYLLAKNPARVQSFELSFGRAHVYYPEATEERCTAALLLDLDPLDLVRSARRRKAGRGLLTQYVNDRPYVASSFMSVAISEVLRSALGGRSKERQALADTAIPLEIMITPLPARGRGRGGSEGLLQGLFEPLGYALESTQAPLDPSFEAWGPSPYHTITLRAEKRLSEVLTHLYVLIPVLDDDKHYWVGDDEVTKLLQKGSGWLEAHPLRERIAARYLKHQRKLTRFAVSQLDAAAEAAAEAEIEAQASLDIDASSAADPKMSLGEQRIGAVVAALRGAKAERVVDVGCGPGKLLRALLADRGFVRVVGMDVSARSLEIAGERLHLEDMPTRQRERVDLFQGSLTYRDERLRGYDAIACVEVIEHIDPCRLAAFERVVFEFAAPATVIVTTPNVEYNQRYEALVNGAFRHRDHRFEWTRAEFLQWAKATAERHGYAARVVPIGPLDSELGAPTQMAIFTRGAST